MIQCFIALSKAIATSFRAIVIAEMINLGIIILPKTFVIVILEELDLEEVFGFFVFAIIYYYP